MLINLTDNLKEMDQFFKNCNLPNSISGNRKFKYFYNLKDN